MTEPGKPCDFPGCPETVPIAVGRSYCDTHIDRDKAKLRQRWKDKTERRGSTTARGYGADWRRVRLAKLEADPICEACEERPATLVDHIIALADGGARLDVDNLQSMCRPCHMAKTREDERKRNEKR